MNNLRNIESLNDYSTCGKYYFNLLENLPITPTTIEWSLKFTTTLDRLKIGLWAYRKYPNEKIKYYL